MKSNVVYRYLLLAAIAFTSYSCTSDDDGINIPTTNIAELEAVVINGKWGISFYSDSGEDKTSYFEGYDFIFNSNKLLSAEQDNASIDGTWSITQKNNDNNVGINKEVKFNIFFPFPQKFTELSEDWAVVTLNSSRIELIDLTGENETESTLVFSKI